MNKKNSGAKTQKSFPKTGDTDIPTRNMLV